MLPRPRCLLKWRLAWCARQGPHSPVGYLARGELGELLELMYELDHNGLRGLLDPLRR